MAATCSPQCPTHHRLIVAFLKALSHSLQIAGSWVELLPILPTLQIQEVRRADAEPSPTHPASLWGPPDLGTQQQWACHLGAQQALEHLAQASLQGSTQSLSPTGLCCPSARPTCIQHRVWQPRKDLVVFI